jgi:mono/diheme cytochrome c family protein
MRYVYLVATFLVVLTVSLLGFRGENFTGAPMDVFPEWAFPGMKYQSKFRPQASSTFFADGRADRPLPANVVAASLPLRADDAMYRGKDASGAFVSSFPAGVSIDAKLLVRGQERYTIYCAPCHGPLGDGNGVIKKYGVAATSYHDDRLRQMADGQIFDTITNGSPSKLMLPYSDKIEPEDRWAIVAYVRALQRSRQGTAADVTDAAVRQSLGIR